MTASWPYALAIILSFLCAMVIFELIKIKTGYKSLNEQLQLEKEFKIKRQNYYNVITDAIDELTLTWEIDKHVMELKTLSLGLASKLQRTPPPFVLWADKFRKIGNNIGELLPADQTLSPMLLNETLRIKPHFDNKLRLLFSEIRSCLGDRDDKECDLKIAELHNSVKQFVQLNKDWLELRDIAASGIDLRENVDIKKENWGWLRHGIQNEFRDHVTGKDFVWFPWDVLSKPDLLKKLSDWVSKEIEDMEWKFDTICAMSSTGLPMATFMSTKWQRRLLAIDNYEFRFLPRYIPNQRDKILLVDSAIQSGKHLEKVIKQIHSAGAKVVGVICICFNDLLPSDKERLPIVFDMLNDQTLFYLFKISDIYHVYQEN